MPTDPAALPAPDFHSAAHKALRVLLLQALHALGRTDANDESELQPALAQLDGLCHQVAGHMTGESRVVHTAIEARRPGGAATSTHSHGELLEALATLQEEAVALRRAPGAERGARAQRLYRRLALFTGDKLLHMAHEEAHDALLLQGLYGAAELAAIHARQRSGLRATPPTS